MEEDSKYYYSEKRRDTVETWYSWIVLLVGLTCHIIYFGLTWCVGVYYIIFLEVFEAGSGPTSWVGSINTASMYYLAPIGGLLISRFSCRTMIVVGSLLSAVGLFASFYAQSIVHLYLTFGIFAGGGIGIAFIPIITLTSRYFDRHRALAMGLCTSGIGIALLLMPIVIGLIRDHYGWRGSLIVFSAFMVQTVALAALAKPIHIPEDDELDDSDIDLKVNSFSQAFHLDVFKNKQYIVLCISDFMVLFGFSVILVHLAAYAEMNGVASSFTYAALGIGQLIGRLFFGLLDQWQRNDTVIVYNIAIFFSGLSVILLPIISNVALTIALIGLHAFFQGSCGPYLPQIVIEFQGIKKLAPAYGYILLWEGTGILLGAPTAGILFDLTKQYDNSFFLGGGAMLLAACVMIPIRPCFSPKSGRTMANIDQSRLNSWKSCEILAGSLARLATSNSRVHHGTLESLFLSAEFLARRRSASEPLPRVNSRLLY